MYLVSELTTILKNRLLTAAPPQPFHSTSWLDSSTGRIANSYRFLLLLLP